MMHSARDFKHAPALFSPNKIRGKRDFFDRENGNNTRLIYGGTFHRKGEQA